MGARRSVVGRRSRVPIGLVATGLAPVEFWLIWCCIMAVHSGSSRVWWGTFELDRTEFGRWRIGPTELWIQRLPGEWRVSTRPAEGPENAVDVEVPAEGLESVPATTVRFALSQPSRSIALSPRLADRAVVSRPAKPFFVPARESVTVFAGSPLWVALSLDDREESFGELAIQRPTDTWFGLLTDAGELCYAAGTACLLQRNAVEPQPHRAFTMVQIENRTGSRALLERIKIPVDYLDLYRAVDGGLWTQDVALALTDSASPDSTEVRAGVPTLAPEGERVANARVDRTSSIAAVLTEILR